MEIDIIEIDIIETRELRIKTCYSYEKIEYLKRYY